MPPKLYDVSVDIHASMHVYPGDPKFHSNTVSSQENGDLFECHKITLSNHAGTHVDAPSHFVKGGMTVTDIPLEVLNGRARVVEISNTEKVDVAELQQLVLVDDFRILFKTKNSQIWNSHKHFCKDHAYITADAAKYLAENGIKLVGFDYLSVDRYGDDSYATHKSLLSNQIVILEGLNLSQIIPGEYDLACLPMRLKGLDAAPARVLLKK
jgi:arylformamidase